MSEMVIVHVCTSFTSLTSDIRKLCLLREGSQFASQVKSELKTANELLLHFLLFLN